MEKTKGIKLLKAKKRNKYAQDFQLNRSLYIMMIPVLIYFTVFCYFPMYGVLMAFQDYSPRLGVAGSDWVGFRHFINLFQSPTFPLLVKNTLSINLLSLAFGFPAPIILALLMNELNNKRFAKIVQNATYLPHFISVVIACGLIKEFTTNTGLIGDIIKMCGGTPKTLLNYKEYFAPVYVISGIWQQIGWNSIIYLAALTAIDGQLYEAAEIDGAGKLKQLIHITIPSIMPTIVMLLIMRVGQLMSLGYEKIILLYNEATMNSVDVISSYVYRRGLINRDYSFSAAVGLFNNIINIALLIIANTISRKVNDSSLW